MSCDLSLAACQLSRTVDAAGGGWDWNAFLSTVIATLIGGVLGVLGVWLSFRWQRKHRYREVLDDCIVKVLEQIALHATELRRLQRQREFVDYYERKNLDYFARTGEAALDEPADFTMSITLDIAQMRARGEDQQIVTDAIRAHDQIRGMTDILERLQMLGVLGGALARWRSAIWTPQRARESLARVRAVAGPLDVEID